MPSGVLPPLVNPAAAVRRIAQGREREPVLVIDDVLADPDRWRDAAADAQYARIGPHYPGIRSPIARETSARLCAELGSLVGDAFGGSLPPPLECFFSIVTTPPEALAPIQRLPHVDGLERSRIAILVYLSGTDQGGTAFYRQRATGFETVDRSRFSAFDAALRAGVAEHGLPAAAYISGDTPLYDQVANHAARPNRALIYRSSLLHCAAIPPGVALPADPRTGRLSINAFLLDPAEAR